MSISGDFALKYFCLVFPLICSTLFFLFTWKKNIAEAALEQNTKQAYARLMAMPQGVLASGRKG